MSQFSLSSGATGNILPPTSIATRSLAVISANDSLLVNHLQLKRYKSVLTTFKTDYPATTFWKYSPLGFFPQWYPGAPITSFSRTTEGRSTSLGDGYYHVPASLPPFPKSSSPRISRPMLPHTRASPACQSPAEIVGQFQVGSSSLRVL
jgi:hypothetical protein